MAYVTFEVGDLQVEIEGKTVLIDQKSLSNELNVAFIEVNGVPVELIEYNEKYT